MKIGILTFHWATNYGAILQAYSLCKYLNINGFDAEIIRYEPRNYLISLRNIKQVRSLKEFTDYVHKIKTEKTMRKFRIKNLKQSCFIYNNVKELESSNLNYDCIIVGSDQIWNKSFTISEGPLYFLNFVGEKVKKISYAASFGVRELDKNLENLIFPLLKQFTAISVRENSGKSIVNNMGLSSTIVCDPVFLLDRSFFFNYVTKSKNKTIFIYMLKNDWKQWQEKLSMLKDSYNIIVWGKDKVFSVEEWLSMISNSSLLITDSFHGVAFSLIFNTPFISVEINGSGMNDRLETILNEVELSSLFVKSKNLDKISKIPEINWDKTNKLLNNYKIKSENFLKENLYGNIE